jgi:hypothetical protein
MAQNVDLFLRSGQTINLEFEHLFLHRTGSDLRAIEFQPKKGGTQLVFADEPHGAAAMLQIANHITPTPERMSFQ